MTDDNIVKLGRFPPHKAVALEVLIAEVKVLDAENQNLAALINEARNERDTAEAQMRSGRIRAFIFGAVTGWLAIAVSGYVTMLMAG